MESHSASVPNEHNLETAAKSLVKVESLLGYGVKTKALRDFIASKLIDDTCSSDEQFGYYVRDAVHWVGEFHEGLDPAQTALAAQFARLERPLPKKPLPPQSPEVMARHFCGLLPIDVGFLKGGDGRQVVEYALADLNLRSDLQTEPIYIWSTKRRSPWFVFSSVVEREDWKNGERELGYAEAMQDADAMKQLIASLPERFPRAYTYSGFSLVRQGVSLPVPPPKPAAEASFSDPMASLIWDTFDAFLPIASALIERSKGNVDAALSSAEVHRCQEIADGHEGWPPTLLLRLLGLALSGATKDTREFAERILACSQGVPLTQRWAKRVSLGEPPFDKR